MKNGRRKRGYEYFNRMVESGLYTMDKDGIYNRVRKLNLEGIFNGKFL